MSKRIDLGPVLPIHKGDWKSGTTYERLNTVRHKSASWVCKAVTTTDEPSTDSANWFLQSEDSSGVASVNGQTGVVRITDTLSTPALTDDSTLLANTAWVNDRIEQTVDSVNNTITSTAEETLAEATSFTTTAISEAMTDADTNNSKTFATKTELDVVRANLVDISTNQTIGGTKIFSQPIQGSITGTAASADKASKDALGNTIDTTYASKTELASTIRNTSNTILGTVTSNYLNKTDAAATYITPTAVDTKIANVVASAPANLNTLAKLATAVTTNQTNIGTLTTAVDSKANVDDVVTLTGTQSITGAKTFASTITGSVSGNAGTATKLANSVNFEGVVFDGSANVDRYAQTSDDGTTAAKTVSIHSPFELAHGAEITIIVGKHDTSTTGELTLNVNSTGAKPITYKNKPFDRTFWKQSEIFKFVYDGTSWRFVGQLNTDTTYTAATAAPVVAGTATAGTSTKYAREDHVHPVQTSVTGSSGSCTGNAATATKATQDGNGNNIALTYATKTELNAKANTASPTFTGTPTAPTATAGTNNTQIATTAYVTNAVSKKLSSISAGTGISVNGSTVSLAAVVSAGNTGPTANASPVHGATFTVPYIAYDAYGRVTGSANRTITLPNIGVGGHTAPIWGSYTTLTENTVHTMASHGFIYAEFYVHANDSIGVTFYLNNVAVALKGCNYSFNTFLIPVKQGDTVKFVRDNNNIEDAVVRFHAAR